MNKQRGFTLLEVLMAFMIMGLLMGVGFQAASISLNGAMQSQEYDLSAMHAQSLLARLGADIDLSQQSETGEFEDGFSWRVEMADYEDPDADVQAQLQDKLLRITITVSRAGHDVEFVTLRGKPRG